MSYQDIKETSTVWVKQLLDEGVIDGDTHDKWLGQFIDLESGELPPEYKSPQGGNEHSFGLYNRKNGYSSKKLLDGDTITITTENGYYISGDIAGKVSLVKNPEFPDSIEWVVKNLKDHQYSIKSTRNGKYLGVFEGVFSATRESITPETAWYVKPRGNGITFSHVLYGGIMSGEGLKLSLREGVRKGQVFIITNLKGNQTLGYERFDGGELGKQKIEYFKRMTKLRIVVDNTDLEIELLRKLSEDVEEKYGYLNKVIGKNASNINEDYANMARSIKSNATTCIKSQTYIDENDCVIDNTGICKRNNDIQMAVKAGQRYMGRCLLDGTKNTSTKYKICKPKSECLDSVGESQKDTKLLNKYMENVDRNKFDYSEINPFDDDDRDNLDVGVNVAKNMKLQEITDVMNNLEISRESNKLEYKEVLDGFNLWQEQLDKEIKIKDEKIRQNDILISRQINLQEQATESINYVGEKVDTLGRTDGISSVNAEKIVGETTSMTREYWGLQIILIISLIIIVLLAKKKLGSS